MFRHIVSWNFNEDVSEEERAAIRTELSEKFHALVGVIPGLLKVEVGMPPHPTSNADLVLYCEMENENTFTVYHDHPEHIKVATIIRSHCHDRRCTNFYAE